MNHNEFTRVSDNKIRDGGQGTVYRVDHDIFSAWGQALAVKIFQDKEDSQAWRRDLNSLTFLTHPNIVRIVYILYENSDDRSQLRRPIGYVMELMAQSAADLIAQLAAGRFECTLPQMLNLFVQVARALTFAHENGVIHFDVKPDNILLDESCTVAKLCDFGLAHKLKSLSMSARSSSFANAKQRGTWGYIAPEADDENFESSPLLKLCDVFSFGKTMWQLLHPSRSMPLTLPLKFYAAHLPTALTELILQCTSEDLSNRPQMMSQVLMMLQRIQKEM
jgi:eukaryotic-like serine/threonine-protein kinase